MNMQGRKLKTLQPIRESSKDFEDIELEILRLFKQEIYIPLVKLLGLKKREILSNSVKDLVDAIASGRVSYEKGIFTGKLSSVITKELRKLGAAWDRKRRGFVLPQSKLTSDIKMAISVSQSRFERTLRSIDSKLAQTTPESISEKLKLETLFESVLDRTEKKITSQITIPVKVTPEMRRRIADEYTKNMQLYIKDFVEEEIIELRNKVAVRAASGMRYEGLAKEIEKSYGVSKNKAKFLARQETSLMMTKYKQTRYEDAGVKRYKWQCVTGSPQHPVRPLHLRHNGKIFSWDNPPIVDEEGNRKSPGQDYNCRCVAIPVVDFSK